jgi:DNA-binding response OmpR family regulator
VKPFSPRELAARIRAILRRVDRVDEAAEVVVAGDVTIDRARHTVVVAGRSVHLTAKEFSLLLALIDARGRVLSREHLLQEHWGYSYADGMRTIDVHVRRLREKLPSIATGIRAVKPIGYRFSLTEDVA